MCCVMRLCGISLNIRNHQRLNITSHTAELQETIYLRNCYANPDSSMRSHLRVLRGSQRLYSCIYIVIYDNIVSCVLPADPAEAAECQFVVQPSRCQFSLSSFRCHLTFAFHLMLRRGSFRPTSFAFHLSPFTFRLSPFAFHLLSFISPSRGLPTFHLLILLFTFHLPPFTFHLSPFTFHFPHSRCDEEHCQSATKEVPGY